MVENNGLASRGGKIKLNNTIGKDLLGRYEDSSDVIFSCNADGLYVQYQWQVKRGESWFNVPGATSKKLRMNLITPGENGKVFRCRVYNNIGEVFTDEVTLNVNQPTSAPVITSQPTSTTVSTKTGTSANKDKIAKITVSPN